MVFWVSVVLGFWVGVWFFGGVFLCLFFFKRTSVIIPIYNSYVTKFFKTGEGQMQCNYGHDATEGSRSYMKTSSSLLRCAVLRKRERVALSMNWCNRFLFVFAIVFPETIIN